VEPKERRQREREEVRTKILDAARALLLEAGVEAVTMRKIADRIGYTATALYFHFPDKESLLCELMEEDFLRFRRAFDRLERVADPMERLVRMGKAYVEFGLRNPGHYRLMFMVPPPADMFAGGGTPPTKRIEQGNPGQDAYALLRSVVAECVAAGRFRPGLDDVELLTQVIWSGVHGLVSLQINRDPWVRWTPMGRRRRLGCEAHLRGLARDPEEVAALVRLVYGPGHEDEAPADADTAVAEQPAVPEPTSRKGGKRR
jgi:AcrR family transcriptional regulator